MGLEKALIVSVLGALAYVYVLADDEQQEQDLLNGLSCGPIARLKTNEEGQLYCEPKLKCKEGFVLAPNMAQCLDIENPCGPGFIMLENGQCEVTDEACGNKCYKLNDAKDDCVKIANCGTVTGNEMGDIALYWGESFVAGYIYDFVGRKVASAAERRVAQETARKASLEASKAAANKAAGQVAQSTAKNASTKLATKVAQTQLAARATQVATKNTVIKTLTLVAKKLATKIAIQLAKITAMASTGIGILATPLMILSTSLSIGMTAAGIVFESPPGSKDWDRDVPEAAKVAITAIPVFGDLIDMVFPYIYFTDNCAPGLEDQNGLCYPPAEKDFQCEAFLCMPHADRMPGYIANNFLGGTKHHLTKKIITDTGTIPNKCPAGKQHGVESTSAAPGFCYDIQPEPGSIVLGTWWESCKSDEREDGAVCGKETIDRKSTRLKSSHVSETRMPSSVVKKTLI